MKLQSLFILSLFLLFVKVWAWHMAANFKHIIELACEAVKKMAELEKMCLSTKGQTQFFELCF
ncbi:hypothetical protein EGI24_00435 [Lacihabitans sp. CS3-21]|nr:hypothetical protein [Lacihabitans sp. CS3-21]